MSRNSGYVVHDVDRRRSGAFTHASVANGAIMLLMTLVAAAPWFNLKTASFTGEGNPIRQYSYLAVLAVTIYACRLRDYPARILALPLSLTVALAYCWASLLWSDAAGIAARRLILTTVIIWSIFAAVRVAGIEGTLRSLRAVMLAVLVLNLLFSILVPSIGVHSAGGWMDSDSGRLAGDWRGVLGHKNWAGPFSAMTVLTFFFCNRDMRPLLRWAVIIGAAAFLVKTNSKTSMALLALSLALGVAFTRYHPRYRLLALPLSLVLAGIAAILASSYWDFLVGPLQSEDALTGRVQIWPVLLAYWHDNPWLGAGYGSFWNVGAGSPLFGYVKATSWVGGLGNGHNGYLDLLVTIGLPGFLVVVACVILWPLFKLFWSLGLSGGLRGYVFAVLLFCALHNFTETSLLERDAIVNTFLILSLALLETGSRGDESARRAAAMPLRRGYRGIP